MAGAALGFLAAVAAFFVGFQEALSWDATAVVFTAFSFAPVALLVWKGGALWAGRSRGLGWAMARPGGPLGLGT